MIVIASLLQCMYHVFNCCTLLPCNDTLSCECIESYVSHVWLLLLLIELKGITAKSDVGFLTLLEHLRYCEVTVLSLAG